MLADENFTSRFVADISGFTSNVDKGASAVSHLTAELQRTGKVTDEVISGLNKAGNQIAKGNIGIKTAAGNYGKVSESAGIASKSAQSFGASQQGIISGRYALYDVAFAYGAVSAALLATSAGAIKVGSEFQSAFANVKRSSQDSSSGLGVLRKELADLSTQIPQSFEQLSAIATLGNQLGVASGDVAEFTKVVAQFSVAANISVDEAALVFGQLGNLLGVGADQYSNLGSAIALVGVKSAATESQIIAVAREIAPIAKDAGFSAAQVIGLSGALASLRVPAERSRSTLLQFFEGLNKATAEGGARFQNFATVVGVSVDELDRMVRGGQGAEIFQKFIKTLSGADTVQITQALGDLGLASLRVTPTVRALANNTTLLNQTMADGAKGFSDNTELARQYGEIVGTLSSQWQIFVNALNQAIDTLTQGSVEGLAGLLNVLTNIVVQFTAFAGNPIVQRIAQIGLAVVTVTGVFLAFRVASMLSTASVLALIAAQERLGVSGAVGGLRGLIGLLFGLTGAANGATGATSRLTLAVRGFARATVILAVIGAATELIFNFGESMQWATSILVPFLRFLGDAEMNLANLLGATGKFYSAIGGLYAGVGKAYSDAGTNLAKFSNATKTIASGAESWSKSLTPATDATGQLGNVSSLAATNMEDLAGSMDTAGGSAGGAAAAIRTLVDYASDLTGVFSRAFDIRFGPQLGFDSITSAWSDLNDQMDEYRRKVAELTADRSVKEYFLGIANAYNDTLRAGVLTSDIADLNAQIADATGKSSTELVGNSKAAITNRKRLTDLSKTYSDYITALASSGASQDELNAAVAQSKIDFTNQALALGYSNQQLQPYIASFRDLATIIATVPRNITVTANVDPALQALNEYAAKLQSISGGSYGGGTIKAPIVEQPRYVVEPFDRGKYYNAFLNNSITPEQYHRYVYGYKDGGYTGGKGVSQMAGVVHGQEFVMNAKATKNIGVGNLYAMQKAAKGGRGYQQGGYVAPVRTAPTASGMGVMQLSAEDRRLLISIRDNIGVTIGASAVANAVGNANQNSYSRGAA